MCEKVLVGEKFYFPCIMYALFFHDSPCDFFSISKKKEIKKIIFGKHFFFPHQSG